MKRSTPVRLAAVLLALIPVAFSEAHPTQRPPDGGTREVLVSILIPSLPNAPFSAIVSTESIRQLADGTTITLKNRRAIARDSAGRIFQERRLLVPDMANTSRQSRSLKSAIPLLTTSIFVYPGKTYARRKLLPRLLLCRPECDESQKVRRQPLTECRPSSPSYGLDTIGTRETSVIEAVALVLPLKSLAHISSSSDCR